MNNIRRQDTPHISNEHGVTLIVMVLAIMVFGVLGAVLVSMQSTQFETARALFREGQAFYVGDSGVARGKHVLAENPLGYLGPTRSSPWAA